MAKIVGYGFYEAAGIVEREYTPYTSSVQPYDLNVPGRVAEIKRVLQALGDYASDPNRNPSNTQTEDTHRYIDTSPTHIDSWDGPTADAFALTVGRHRDRFPGLMTPGQKSGPLIQVVKHRTKENGDLVVVGGPQPTVLGLELIAQAAHEVLHDSLQLDQYLAWRGGTLDCFSLDKGSCIPPDSSVVSSYALGKPYDPRGWTIADEKGEVAQVYPDLVIQLHDVQSRMEKLWSEAPFKETESARKRVADEIVDLRGERDALVRKLNQRSDDPGCPAPSQKYDRKTGKCVSRCSELEVWDPVLSACTMPPVTVPVDESNLDIVQAGTVLVGVGLAMYLLSKVVPFD